MEMVTRLVDAFHKRRGAETYKRSPNTLKLENGLLTRNNVRQLGVGLDLFRDAASRDRNKVAVDLYCVEIVPRLQDGVDPCENVASHRRAMDGCGLCRVKVCDD